MVADPPGLEKDDININAMEDTLEISAETKKAVEAKKPRAKIQAFLQKATLTRKG